MLAARMASSAPYPPKSKYQGIGRKLSLVPQTERPYPIPEVLSPAAQQKNCRRYILRQFLIISKKDVSGIALHQFGEYCTGSPQALGSLVVAIIIALVQAVDSHAVAGGGMDKLVVPDVDAHM